MQQRNDYPINEFLYIPKKDEAQFSVRALLVGLVLAFFVSMINVYFGLQLGWGVGGSLISAILAYAFFVCLRPKNRTRFWKII